MDAIALGRVDEEVAHRDARAERRRRLRAAAAKPSSTEAAPFALIRDNPLPTPPFWGRRLATDIPLERIFPFINELALFRGQWGFKQGRLSPEEFERLTDEKARPVLQHLQRQAIGEGFIQPKVVWGYFPVQSQGDELIVYEPEGSGFGVQGSDNPKSKIQNPKSLLRFSFPRQEGRRRLCIADFFRPVSSGQFDVLGLQLVTVGDQATRLAEDLRRRDRYQEYLYVHGFAVECAEALAEYWHQRMRAELGFAHEDAPDIRQLFQQNYRGSRYSFGYPACPDLEERAKIVQLLRPDEIGVALSESFMLVPEQSTDALVVHHPQAKYFDV
jgi:5-methyltetrahydrofolate--homocysteine methyltransferase